VLKGVGRKKIFWGEGNEKTRPKNSTIKPLYLISIMIENPGGPLPPTTDAHVRACSCGPIHVVGWNYVLNFSIGKRGVEKLYLNPNRYLKIEIRGNLREKLKAI